MATGFGSSDAGNEATGRDESVVRSENGGPKPTDSRTAMYFSVTHDQIPLEPFEKGRSKASARIAAENADIGAAGAG